MPHMLPSWPFTHINVTTSNKRESGVKMEKQGAMPCPTCCPCGRSVHQGRHAMPHMQPVWPFSVSREGVPCQACCPCGCSVCQGRACHATHEQRGGRVTVSQQQAAWVMAGTVAAFKQAASQQQRESPWGKQPSVRGWHDGNDVVSRTARIGWRVAAGEDGNPWAVPESNSSPRSSKVGGSLDGGNKEVRS